MKYNPPICVNQGCGTRVGFSRTLKGGKRVWNCTCPSCRKASRGKAPYKPGVIPRRKGSCENKPGVLGFPCLPSLSGQLEDAASVYKGLTHIDHIDGNHENNSPENIMELCVFCHTIKTAKNNDHISSFSVDTKKQSVYNRHKK